MKLRQFLTITILLFGGAVLSQSNSAITIEASQNVTNFAFKDSLNQKDNSYSPSFSGGYAFGYRFESSKGFLFTTKIGMRKAGATYVYDAINYSWSLQYAEIRLGLGYNYKLGKVGIHALAQPYFGYLLKANQTLNNENFNIIKSGDIGMEDYGVIGSLGANFAPSDMISVYLDVNYMFGLANLETNTSQKSRNTLIGATLGVAFKFNRTNKEK